MRRLIAWNVMPLDGRFEGTQPWQLDMHGTVWAASSKLFSPRPRRRDRDAALRAPHRRRHARLLDEANRADREMMNGLNKAVASRTLPVCCRLVEQPTSEGGRRRDGQVAQAGGRPRRFRLRQRRSARDIAGRRSGRRVPALPRACHLGEGTPLLKPASGRTHFSLREVRPLRTDGLILFYERKSG